MDIQSYDFHTGPGRRLAKGCTRGDTLLAAFGFFAHMFLFLAIGAGITLHHHASGWWTVWICGPIALLLLGLRASQVGVSTTNESVQAIKDAWSLSKSEKP